MVFDHQDEHRSQLAATCSMAAKFGMYSETLRHCPSSGGSSG